MDIKVKIICSISHTTILSNTYDEHVYRNGYDSRTESETRALYGMDARCTVRDAAANARLLFLPRLCLDWTNGERLVVFLRRHWKAFKCFHYLRLKVYVDRTYMPRLPRLPRAGGWTVSYRCEMRPQLPIRHFFEKCLAPDVAASDDNVGFVVKSADLLLADA